MPETLPHVTLLMSHKLHVCGNVEPFPVRGRSPRHTFLPPKFSSQRSLSCQGTVLLNRNITIDTDYNIDIDYLVICMTSKGKNILTFFS